MFVSSAQQIHFSVFFFSKLHFLQNFYLLGVLTRGGLLDKHDLFHLVICKIACDLSPHFLRSPFYSLQRKETDTVRHRLPLGMHWA